MLGILEYSDDTAMARCVVQSLLTRTGFDEQDMARRYCKHVHTLLACDCVVELTASTLYELN